MNQCANNQLGLVQIELSHWLNWMMKIAWSIWRQRIEPCAPIWFRVQAEVAYLRQQLIHIYIENRVEKCLYLWYRNYHHCWLDLQQFVVKVTSEKFTSRLLPWVCLKIAKVSFSIQRHERNVRSGISWLAQDFFSPSHLWPMNLWSLLTCDFHQEIIILNVSIE